MHLDLKVNNRGKLIEAISYELKLTIYRFQGDKPEKVSLIKKKAKINSDLYTIRYELGFLHSYEIDEIRVTLHRSWIKRERFIYYGLPKLRNSANLTFQPTKDDLVTHLDHTLVEPFSVGRWRWRALSWINLR